MLDPNQEMTVSWRGDEANVTSIERALGRLLQDLNPPAEEGQPHPPIRASLLNRIVMVADERAEETQAYQALSILSQLHPSRTVFASVDRDAPEAGLDASATVHCLLRSGTEPRVCLEEVRLAARGELADHLASVVAPLLVPDMPVVLWWMGEPPSPDETLLSLCDRLVVDSDRAGPAKLSRILAILEAWGGRMIVTDIAWAHLTFWRELLAQLFDPPETRLYQRRLDGLSIEYASGMKTTRPCLLLGWLSAQLGWTEGSPGQEGSSGGPRLRGPAGEVRVVLRAVPPPAGSEPGDILSVSLSALHEGDEAIFSVTRCEDRTCATVRTLLPGRPEEARTVPLAPSSWSELLSRELDLRSGDPAYPRSLAAAVPLAAAVREADLTVAQNLDELSRSAADLVVERATEAVAGRGRFTMALSGGSTPKGLYELLATPPWRDRIDWSRCHFFWGDERLVPPDHPDSNYRLAHESFLSRVPVPPEQVHRVPVEAGGPTEVATAYEDELRRFFGSDEEEKPRFDLILLGIGSDGHTASLFPGSPALLESRRWVVATPPGVLPPEVHRVTFTLSALNKARFVLFLSAGKDKAPALRWVLQGESDLPGAMVRPVAGTVHWLVDVDAASELGH